MDPVRPRPPVRPGPGAAGGSRGSRRHGVGAVAARGWPPVHRHPPALHRRRRVFVALVLLNLVELAGVDCWSARASGSASRSRRACSGCTSYTCATARWRARPPPRGGPGGGLAGGPPSRRYAANRPAGPPPAARPSGEWQHSANPYAGPRWDGSRPAPASRSVRWRRVGVLSASRVGYAGARTRQDGRAPIGVVDDCSGFLWRCWLGLLADLAVVRRSRWTLAPGRTGYDDSHREGRTC